MSTSDKSEESLNERNAGVRLRKVSMEAPWQWLSKGWMDLWRHPAISLGYGLVFAGVMAGLAWALSVIDLAAIVLPLGAGFMLIGPLLAVGLYEISRRLEVGERIRRRDVIFVRTKSPTQLGFLGVLLMIVLLVWVEIAALLLMLFFGMTGFPPLQELVNTMLFTWPGLGLLAGGSLIGGILAFVIFAFSAISVPMLMVRDVDAITAVILSIRTVRSNLGPMVLWAWLIAVMIGVGLATLFVGLIVTFPLIGHATWHSYRDLVEETN
jgi:uncharacterized membrane protein